MSYATLTEFKTAIGIGTADTTDDTPLQMRVVITHHSFPRRDA